MMVVGERCDECCSIIASIVVVTVFAYVCLPCVCVCVCLLLRAWMRDRGRESVLHV